MYSHFFNLKVCFLILSISSFYIANAQKILIDNFDSLEGWNIYKSEGVETDTHLSDGISGKAIRFEYNFTKGAGYGGIQKNIFIELPDNYQFSFFIRAHSPNNNLEIKFLDYNGENVWWVNNRNFTFPKEWTKFIVKKRHIEFAWGPTQEKKLKNIYKIEFTIASYSGGAGWIEFDSLEFQPLPLDSSAKTVPLFFSSDDLDKRYSVNNIFDSDSNTKWLSKKSEKAGFIIDFQTYREIGGFKIEWDKENLPEQFDISISDDGEKWNLIHSVERNADDISFVRLVNVEGRKIKFELKKSSSKQFGICELEILEPSETENLNKFFINIAKNYPKGFFPRYFYQQASYWNVVGVDSDYKEALINEEGMIEVDKLSFSIEPMISINNKLITWNDVLLEQSLEDNYLPIPIVKWKIPEINLSIKPFAAGKANSNSTLFITYKIENHSDKNVKGYLYLLLRPFQVNPYYQWLNVNGGVSKINSIEINENQILVDSEKFIRFTPEFENAGALRFESGNIVSYLSQGKFPSEKKIFDKTGLASGVLSFPFELNAGESKEINLIIPFHNSVISSYSLNPGELTQKDLIQELLLDTKRFWIEKLNRIKFNLPSFSEKIINTWKSNLAYILINRDGFGIQPGSRSYERSWIRDGSLTSSALLKSAIVNEVKDFIDWYSQYQFDNGKIPCVVDKRGADPVPEHDSHGQYIFLIKQYFNFTKDTSLLIKYNKNILKAVDYIKSLIDERSTEHFKYGNDSVRAYYGILPESISHEGYSAKPMHSFWDDFFALRGLKDATDIQLILGNQKEYERVKLLRDKFKVDLYNSLNLAIRTRKIDYIPGSVELGDFDPTSTTIALSPVNEINILPQPYLKNTFDKYYNFFQERKEGEIDSSSQNESGTNWINFTPYENRTIGSFILLDEPEKAHELIKFFLNYQRPQGWNHWAEVVWKDKRFPGFIGDMPHTWVGSDFINSVRAMFVYENDYDSSLVVGAALYDDWINATDGMSVENLPTYYGNLSYSIRKVEQKYFVKFYGDIQLPSGKIKLKNLVNNQKPVKVILNGKESDSFDNSFITISEFPSTIEILY